MHFNCFSDGNGEGENSGAVKKEDSATDGVVHEEAKEEPMDCSMPSNTPNVSTPAETSPTASDTLMNTSSTEEAVGTATVAP